MAGEKHDAHVRVRGETGGAVGAMRHFSDSTKKSIDRVAQLDDRLAKLNLQNAKADERISKLKQRNDELAASLQKSSTNWGAYRNRALAFTATIGASIAVLDRVIERNFKLQNVQQGLPKTLDGARFSIEKAREATRGLIGDFELTSRAVAATRLGIVKSEKDYADLAGAAVKLGTTLGKDVVGSLDSVIEGLGRGSTEMLDNLGIVLKARDAQQRLAKSLGVEVQHLTEKQKSMAIGIEGTKEAIKLAESMTIKVDETTESWLRFKVEMRNYGDEVAPLVVRGLSHVIGSTNLLIDTIAGLDEGESVERGMQGVLLNMQREGKNAQLEIQLLQRDINRMAQAAKDAKNAVDDVFEFAGPTLAQAGLTEASLSARNARKRGGGDTRSEMEKTLGVRLSKEAQADFLSEAPPDVVADIERQRTEARVAELDRRFQKEQDFSRRRMEMMEAQDENASFLRIQAIDAELRHTDKILQITTDKETRLDLLAARDELRHQKKLERIAEEKRAHEAHMMMLAEQEARISAISGHISSAIGGAVFAAIDSEGPLGQSLAKQIQMTATMEARRLLIMGTTELAIGAILLGTGNPLGMVHLSRGGMFLATAAAVRGAGAIAGAAGGQQPIGLLGRLGGSGVSKNPNPFAAQSGGTGFSGAKETRLQTSQAGSQGTSFSDTAGGGGVTIQNLHALEPSEEVGVRVAQSIRRAQNNGRVRIESSPRGGKVAVGA